MSDTTVIIILTAGLIIAVILTAYQEHQIKKLNNKIKDLEKDIAVLNTKLELK